MGDFTLDVELASKLKKAFERNGWNEAEIARLGDGNNLRQVLLWLRGSSAFVPVAHESPLDTTIRVNRAERPVYPEWVGTKYVDAPTTEFLALESSGPSEYNLARVVQWLHKSQKEGRLVSGCVVYRCLEVGKVLESYLGIADGYQIQKKGLVVFRKFFGGKVIFLWRSVVKSRNGNLYVPCLFENGGELKIHWHPLDHILCPNDPALRFAD